MINQGTQIHEALEANVDFSFNDSGNQIPTITPYVCVSDFNSIKLHQKTSVKGKIVFGDNKAENIPNKPDLTKKEGLLIDATGSIPINLE